MKQKPSQHRLGDFLEGKGFYIILLLCVAAIGISGYYLYSGLTAQPEGFGDSAVVSGQAELPKPADQEPAPADQTDQSTAAPTQGQDSKSDQTDPKTDQGKTPAAASPQQESATPGPAATTGYVWPVEGEVDRDFSLEVFAYDDTMGDWRTHDGIDIAAELGTPVAACAKGTVSAVTTDDLMGTTVTIDHGKGMESVYANLSPSLNVQAGTEVDAGTVLGTVGTSAIAESASPSHLHFALREYGVTIDPGHYLH